MTNKVSISPKLKYSPLNTVNWRYLCNPRVAFYLDHLGNDRSSGRVAILPLRTHFKIESTIDVTAFTLA